MGRVAVYPAGIRRQSPGENQAVAGAQQGYARAGARRRAAASTEHARRLIGLQVEQTDYQIDALVYDLYGLTPEEIAVVEESVGTKE